MNKPNVSVKGLLFFFLFGFLILDSLGLDSLPWAVSSSPSPRRVSSRLLPRYSSLFTRHVFTVEARHVSSYAHDSRYTFPPLPLFFSRLLLLYIYTIGRLVYIVLRFR